MCPLGRAMCQKYLLKSNNNHIILVTLEHFAIPDVENFYKGLFQL